MHVEEHVTLEGVTSGRYGSDIQQFFIVAWKGDLVDKFDIPDERNNTMKQFNELLSGLANEAFRMGREYQKKKEA